MSGSKAKTVAKFNMKQISCLNSILNQRKDILKSSNSGDLDKERKTLRKGNFVDLDSKVKEWVENMRARNVELSRDDIVNKANSFAAQQNLQTVNVGRGWFHGFSSRVGLKKNNIYFLTD